MKEVVSSLGNRERGEIDITIQKHAQRKEECDDDSLTEGCEDDVYLRVADGAAAEVALHHILVQACHSDQTECSACNHLPEVAGRGSIVKEENLRLGSGGDELIAIAQTEPHRATQSPDGYADSSDKA